MGINYRTLIVFGVCETEAMAGARQVVEPRDTPVCTNDQKHPIDRRRPPGFCPRCGGKVEVRPIPTERIRNPVHVYAPKGLDPESNDWDYDTVVSSWVHSAFDDDDGVALGVPLLDKLPREDIGAFEIPTPTEEQAEAVRAYLIHLGLDPTSARLILLQGAR